MKALQDKLKHTESKMSEYRIQCSTLKQEVKIAQKVIFHCTVKPVHVVTSIKQSHVLKGHLFIPLPTKLRRDKVTLPSPSVLP